jgi:hypothetical protein
VKFIIRYIGVWVVLISMGSLQLASRYSDAQQRAFLEILQAQHPEMSAQEVFAISTTFGSASEGMIWILNGTSLVWICLLGALAYSKREKSGALGEPSHAAKDCGRGS